MPTNTAAPGIHHHSRASRRAPSRPGARADGDETTRRARASRRRATRSTRPRRCRGAAPTRPRRARTAAATSQTIASPSIPSSIPVPIGPAADCRMSATPRRAYTPSVTRSTTCESSQSKTRNRSYRSGRRRRAPPRRWRRRRPAAARSRRGRRRPAGARQRRPTRRPATGTSQRRTVRGRSRRASRRGPGMLRSNRAPVARAVVAARHGREYG